MKKEKTTGSETELLWTVLFGDGQSWRTRNDALQELGPVVLYAVAVGGLTLLMPIAVQTLVNTVTFGTLTQPLLVLSLILLVALGMSSTFSALSTWTVEVMERRFFLRWYLDVSSRMSRLAKAHENREELVNRLFEVYAAQKSVRSLLVGGLEAALTIAVGLVVLSLYHPILAAFSVLLTLSLWFALAVLGRRGFALARIESQSKYELVAWLEELGIGHRAVASGPRLVREADRRAKHYLQARSDHFVVAFRQHIALWALQAFSMASLLAAGGWLVMQGQLTLGQLVAAELIVSGLGLSVAKLGLYVDTAYDLVASAAKLSHLREGLGTVAEVEGGTTLPAAPWSLRIAEAGVETEVLPGGILLVNGDERAQSDLLDELLLEAHSPTRRIALHDVDVTDVSHRSTRARICFVGRQDIFSGSVFDNACSAADTAIDRDAVRRALKRVGFDGDLDLTLDRCGVPLTAGDLARIGLARALLSRAALVVIDRTLDEFEAEEAARLLDVLRGMTRVVFTRRRDFASLFDGRLTLTSARADSEAA